MSLPISECDHLCERKRKNNCTFLKHAVFVSVFLAQVRERKTERTVFFNVEQHILSDALDQKLDVLYSALLV